MAGSDRADPDQRRMVSTDAHRSNGASGAAGTQVKPVERHDMMSTCAPLTADIPAAIRSGADLRAARQRLGWGLSDIAISLRIRLCHLEALEEGHISLLPGNAYAVGYVRAYARALGLDAEEMVRRFKAEALQVGRRTNLVFPVPMPDRGLPASAVMLLGLVLSIGAYVGWYRLSADGHLPAEAVTAIPERLVPLSKQALPAALNPIHANPAVVADTQATQMPQVGAAGPAAVGSAASGSSSAGSVPAGFVSTGAVPAGPAAAEQIPGSPSLLALPLWALSLLAPFLWAPCFLALPLSALFSPVPALRAW